ncbi:MAG: exodeoxyribonuclease-3 [Woeseiaceae bacterium]|jgi:exodeoxyribonuclease-3|tara:strand:- start:21403 stop:22173 length:771 start_codon:yes stop_codon:yes gene_type:complete
MKIATWNVNSLNVRIGHVLEWLDIANPDILTLQEIKQPNEAFPIEAFKEIGYHAICSGQKTYNGVAIITKKKPEDIITDFPGFDDPQRRILAATIDNTRVINLYVPNGQSVDSDKYVYKLSWLNALIKFLKAEQKLHKNIIILGDFNIAPEDRDVYDAEKWGEEVLCSPKERKALSDIINLGFCDVFRQFDQTEKLFSWWDYRAAGFRRNAGVRIDLILASKILASKCLSSSIDREPRTWERPSDHTPVIAEFDNT